MARNVFGGFWTHQKSSIIKKYVKAYLDIMNRQNFKLIYFDGFAGSGEAETKEGLLTSIALEVLSLEHSRRFDYYYLIEQDPDLANNLKSMSEKYSNQFGRVEVRVEDANKVLADMASAMKENRNLRALAFLDPYGMALDWGSVRQCSGLDIDFWVLVPTGIAYNRMIVRNQEFPKGWLDKLEKATGLSEEDIRQKFYQTTSTPTLFGYENRTEKVSEPVKVIARIYLDQLRTVWKYVSEPFPLANSTGSNMYHLMMGTNNLTGVKIANDIVGKELNAL